MKTIRPKLFDCVEADMRIDKIRLHNFKGFSNSDWIELGSKFNVVVGQNNAGKTALFEALDFVSFESKPHRSSLQDAAHVRNPVSTIELLVSLSGAELKRAILSQNAEIAIPYPQDIGKKFALDILELKSIPIQLIYRPKQWVSTGRASIATDHNFEPSGQNRRFQIVRPTDNKQEVQLGSRGEGPRDSLPEIVGGLLMRSTYVFKAERLNIGKSKIDNKIALATNAANLPSVLLQLQGENPGAFDRLNRYVRDVFPSVARIAAVPVSDNEAEIRISSVDPELERGDLAFPLSDSGTGISQVLAILSVVVISPTSTTIVIDEPNSFLHPSASKTLIELLRREGHQYIVSTHSSEIIRAIDPDFIHLVRWSEGQSKVETLSGNDVQSIRRILSELGVGLTDVFGAEKILWVEGVTEEECFPRIMKFENRKLPKGTKILSVINTGDFEKKQNADLIFRIYEKLSAGNPLVPAAVGFSFDREERTQVEIEDLRRRSNPPISFLPRRSYENFLLEPTAIASVLSDHDAGSAHAAAQVEEWLTKNAANPKYGAEKLWDGNLEIGEWVARVNASALLSDLFSALTETRVIYRKPTHALLLTEWILQNKPEHLLELRRYVANLI